MPSKTTWIVVYDGRAASGDTYDAAVMFTAATIEEAREDKKTFPRDCAVYEYDLIENDGTDESPDKIINGRFIALLGDL